MTSLLPTLLILGGSTRAAAASAVRAGFRPICADRFGDEDLHRLATVLPVRDYRRGLLAAVESVSPTPWLYVGAIENEPELIDAINCRHPLLGNPPEVLRRIRDPFWLERTLRDYNLPVLKHVSGNELPPSQECWLIKPLRSGGGTGIRVWNGQHREGERRVYFQELREGRSISALLIAAPSGVRFIGASEQLIGHEAGAPTEFGYAGSIGPIEVSHITSEQIQRIGTVLANEAGLRGLFGCDFILANDVPWLTEVNPRYTASVEVLERATNWLLLKWHVMACHGQQFESDLPLDSGESQTAAPTPRRTFVGKRIVYATTDVLAPNLEKLTDDAAGPQSSDLTHSPPSRAPEGSRWNRAFALRGTSLENSKFVVPTPANHRDKLGGVAYREASGPGWQTIDQELLLADIPTPHSPLVAGWPICTVFARAASETACRDLLELRASDIKKWTA